MRHTYKAEQWLPYPVELVFAFFANPENLPRLMPAWQKARIEEASFAAPPPRPLVVDPALRRAGVVAGAGSRMTFSFRPFPYCPVRVPWEAEIEDFAWNEGFCDRQLRGPLAYWHHRHRVIVETRANEVGEPTVGTLLRDEVEYEMRFGAVGEMARRLVVERQLRKMFAYRHERTAQVLGMIRRRQA
jgi:ligand-binding SRPBCC domain-containing protein